MPVAAPRPEDPGAAPFGHGYPPVSPAGGASATPPKPSFGGRSMSMPALKRESVEMAKVMNSVKSVMIPGSFHGKPGRFVICPDNHVSFRGVPLLGYWDLLMAFALIVVSVFTPFEVAFML